MRAIAFLFPLALFGVSSGHAQPLPESYAWGPSTNGLRVGVSVHSSDRSNGGARFSIAFENTGDADVVLNLGYMLANGKTRTNRRAPVPRNNDAGRTHRPREEGQCRRGRGSKEIGEEDQVT